ncbi:MAG TPA: three-Cys-motif partner protein TcmP [Terriglobia bacterium]|nr:three-Cys-motif partner protein TcmP [Terriglobia bacterium]
MLDIRRIKSEYTSFGRSMTSEKKSRRVAGKMNGQEISAADGLPVRSSGVWAEEKLYYLRRYMDIFSNGMKKKWGDKLYYVDLFAGPGRCRVRGSDKEFDGSPLIALNDFDFANYYFFESEPACVGALDARAKTRAPNKLDKWRIIPGDCNDKIEEVKLPSEGLGVAFIDPTGISQIPFETVRKLTVDRKIDLIINFPEGMGIRMNLHQYTDTEMNALTRFVGSERWKTRYPQSTTSFDQVCSEIAKEYLANLESLGYRSLDSDWIPVRTDQMH